MVHDGDIGWQGVQGKDTELAVLTYGLYLDRYSNQWLPFTQPEEECSNGVCAIQVQSTRNTAAGGGSTEAANGGGQQNALCAHQLLYSQVKWSMEKPFPLGVFP